MGRKKRAKAKGLASESREATVEIRKACRGPRAVFAVISNRRVAKAEELATESAEGLRDAFNAIPRRQGDETFAICIDFVIR